VTLAGIVRFIFLDTASGDVGDSQFKWLETQLQTKIPYTFVCSHYPIYGGEVPSIYRLESYEERYHLASLLDKYRVYAYVGGHLHGFVHARIDQMEEFVVGAMYPHALDVGDHGYVLFTYDGHALTWQWVKI
jgi:hypothetical protein